MLSVKLSCMLLLHFQIIRRFGFFQIHCFQYVSRYSVYLSAYQKGKMFYNTMKAVLLDAYYSIVEESPTTNRPIHCIQNLIATLFIGPPITYEIIVCCQKTACSMMVNNHYTKISDGRSDAKNGYSNRRSCAKKLQQLVPTA